jgi:hypothetical protein
VRKRISARKIKPDEWLGIMREAQLLGMPTTATMMFGSIETLEERIEHLDVMRRCKTRRTASPRSSRGITCRSRRRCAGKESTGLDYLRVLAISRLYLDNFPHLQASWLTPGLKMGQLALFYGCDDMGGTILEERVVTTPAPPTKRPASSSRNSLSAPASARSCATRTGTCARNGARADSFPARRHDLTRFGPGRPRSTDRDSRRPRRSRCLANPACRGRRAKRLACARVSSLERSPSGRTGRRAARARAAASAYDWSLASSPEERGAIGAVLEPGVVTGRDVARADAFANSRNVPSLTKLLHETHGLGVRPLR